MRFEKDGEVGVEIFNPAKEDFLEEEVRIGGGSVVPCLGKP